MKRWMLGCLLLSLLIGSHTVAKAEEDKFKLSGTIENYVLANGDNHTAGIRDYANWIYLEGRVSPKLRFVLGEFETFGRKQFDENFVDFGGDSQQWRVGRFRSAFGHNDWSELWYSGFPRMPLMKNLALGAGFSINRLDTGIDWHGGTGSQQYQIGLIDAHARAWEPLPMRFNHVVGRVQWYRGAWVVGLNTLMETEQIGTSQNRIFGLDWRWSAPHIQTRGEYFFGRTAAKHSAGYYFDIFYHPPKLTRTTFLTRLESVTGSISKSVSGTAELYTIGAKQILSKYFTAEVSRSWGNGITPAKTRQGWAFQLMSSIHF